MMDSVTNFFKNRFPLVIIYLFIFTLISPLNLKKLFYIMMILTITLLLHNLLHELGHAIGAILLGFKVTRFSLNRVYFEGEPSSLEEIENSSNKFEYGIIAISGCIITNLSGYILLLLVHNLRPGMDLLGFFCWIFILFIFLLGDNGYLIIGSIIMQGDPVGISAGFNISKWVVFFSGLVIAVTNILLIWHYFWLVVL